MASLNEVNLIGNVGRLECKDIPSNKGGRIVNISLATNERWKDKATGEMREETEWHRLVIHGTLASHAEAFLRVGSQIYCKGRLKTRKWSDKDTGVERYATEIFVREFKSLDRKPADSSQKADEEGSAQQSSKQAGQQPQSSAGYPTNFDENLPF